MLAELIALTLAASAVPCTPLPGMEAVLARAETRFLLFGEYHGTVEAPGVFLDAVCAAAATRPVIVGIEHPPSEQKRLDAYLRSDGGARARAALIAGPAWAEQGGRASVAMLDLVEGVRQMKRSGARVRLLAFDRDQTPRGTSAVREEGMARALIEAADVSDALIMVLTGGGHADREGFISAKPPFRSAAQSLPASKLLSLAFARPGGAAWGCRTEPGAAEVCQAWEMPVREPVAARGVVLDSRLRAGFDGVFHAGRPYTASPPARQGGQAVTTPRRSGGSGSAGR